MSKSVETFLASLLPPDRVTVDVDESEFLVSFLQKADRMLAECAGEVANVITQFTRIDDVRISAQPALADLVRQRCFEVQETALEGLVSVLAQRHVDLKTLQLRGLRLRNAASHSSGGSPRPVLSSKDAAFKMLDQFLRSLDTMPDMIFDYAGGRIFGAGWDVQKHSRFVTMARLSWADKLATVLGAVRNSGGVPHVVTAPILSDLENLDLDSVSEIQRSAEHSWVRQFAIGFGFALPFLFVSSWGYADLYLTGAALAAGGVSVAFFYRGISRLVA